MRKHLLSILLLTLGVLTSCTNDDEPRRDPSGRQVEVTFDLRTRAAQGIPTEETSNYELINSYWIVFCKNDGTIVNIVKRTCLPCDLDTYSTKMEMGHYRLYAFANIPDSYLESLGIAVGSKFSAMPSQFASTYYNFGFSSSTLQTVSEYERYIPMTSLEAIPVEVTEQVTQSFSVEVVRLLSKIEFTLQNDTQRTISLHSLSISDLACDNANGTGATPLMLPSNLDDVTFSPAATTATKSSAFATPIVLSAYGSYSGSKLIYYVLPSVANSTTNSFMLSFDMSETGSQTIEHERFALTDPETITRLRRNDWLRIPIVFSDWQMRLEAVSYPPIGGYPEAEVDETSSDEFVVTFSNPGPFSIRPYIRRLSESTDWFGIDNKQVIHGTPTITLPEEDKALFETNGLPTLKPTGEITGALRTGIAGTAHLTLSVDVIESTTPTLVTKTLTRKLFLKL